MIETADLGAALRLTGLRADEVPAVLAAAAWTTQRLSLARDLLSRTTRRAGIPVALGSHGRHEAGPGSDLDLAWLHDPAACSAADAEASRAEAVGLLRAAGFEVPEKTFRRSLALGDLLVHVGGPSDTHENLTHRALVLTESAWLRDPEESRRAWARLFGLYRDGVTRGRHMSSLLNDLHRYYRTVCLDYRHKIEEADRGWAMRYLKLRHSRKTLHLSNVVLHAATAAREPKDGFDALLASRLSQPPLVKVTLALEDLGGAGHAAPLWLAYDVFLAATSDPLVRGELDALATGDEAGSPAYAALKDNAHRLDAACEEIVAFLMGDARTRGHLVRFGLL